MGLERGASPSGYWVVDVGAIVGLSQSVPKLASVGDFT